MDLLTTAILGYVGYKLLIEKDSRVADLRKAAQGMLVNATELEATGQVAAATGLRNTAQALLAQAAGIESGRIK